MLATQSQPTEWQPSAVAALELDDGAGLARAFSELALLFSIPSEHAIHLWRSLAGASPSSSPRPLDIAVGEPERAAISNFDFSVTIGSRGGVRFALDPAGGVRGSEAFRRAGEGGGVAAVFRWMELESHRALSLVQDLIPPYPELVPPLPFEVLAAPTWASTSRSLEAYINVSHRHLAELLVRVPSWTRWLLPEQPTARWIALQSKLMKLDGPSFVGVSSASDGTSGLRVYFCASELTANDLQRIAAEAGESAGALLHLWRSLVTSTNSGGTTSGALLSVGFTGNEALDVGVTIPSSTVSLDDHAVRKRLEVLAEVHGIRSDDYSVSLEAMSAASGRPPEHRMIQFSTDGDSVSLTATLRPRFAGSSDGRDR
jgi:hypothetical protein